MVPDDFPMYEEWENLTHQGVAFTIAYRQQIYEICSEIITTLINCFSGLNKHMRSHPETELVCHQEKTRHFSYYSWLIQHIDNILQEDNIFIHSNELPELPAPTYSPSVNNLEMLHRIHVMSHAWRELDHALLEATIIHREFMLEKTHMNNTSFSRIRNVDNMTDMGYSLNRVSPIFREQGQTPAQSTKPRNPTSTPRHRAGHINKNSFVPQGADTQHDGRSSPYDPDQSVEKQMVQTTEHRMHKHLPQTLMVKIRFRIREVYPVQLVPQFQVADIHSHPTRDWVRRHPNKIIHSLPFQIYLHEPVHTHRAEI